MGKGKFSIIIVPHDLRKTRTYRLHYSAFYAIVALAGIGLVVVLFFVATYGALLIKTKEFKIYKLKVEELSKSQAQINELKRNLAELRAMNAQIRSMLGLQLAPSDSSVISSSRLAASNEASRTSTEQAAMMRAIPTFWPVRGFVTRGFVGAPQGGSTPMHPGIDIAVERGTPVKAAADGYVVEAGWSDEYGYYVKIDHGYSIKTLYGHNDMLVVVVGDAVVQGQTIAYSGNTGKSTAPHLHFQVLQNNSPVDPMKYLLQ